MIESNLHSNWMNDTENLYKSLKSMNSMAAGRCGGVQEGQQIVTCTPVGLGVARLDFTPLLVPAILGIPPRSTPVSTWTAAQSEPWLRENIQSWTRLKSGKLAVEPFHEPYEDKVMKTVLAIETSRYKDMTVDCATSGTKHSKGAPL